MCIRDRYKTLNNKALNKEEIINLTVSKSTKVSELLEIILKENKLKKYVILEKKGTQGDSFGYHASNNYLKKKFKGYKFINLHDGIKRYFQWINSIPVKKNINSYHPFKINQN